LIPNYFHFSSLTLLTNRYHRPHEQNNHQPPRKVPQMWRGGAIRQASGNVCTGSSEAVGYVGADNFASCDSRRLEMQLVPARVRGSLRAVTSASLHRVGWRRPHVHVRCKGRRSPASSPDSLTRSGRLYRLHVQQVLRLDAIDLPPSVSVVKCGQFPGLDQPSDRPPRCLCDLTGFFFSQ